MRKATAFGATMLAAVACVLTFGLGSGRAEQLSNSTTYLDSVGDNPGGPDIQSITVSNDDTGIVSFAIQFANNPTLGGNTAEDIYIDSDNNPNDGGGADYAGADIVLDLSNNTVDLANWNASKNEFDYATTSPSSLIWSYQGGVLTIKVKASDVNLTTFNFWVAADPDDTSDSAPIDYAPDADKGTFAYTVKITPPAPKPTPKKTIPKCKKGHKSTKAHPCHK